MSGRGAVWAASGLLILGGVAHAQPLENVPAVNAIETAPTEQGGAARAVAVLSGGDPLIVGTAKLAGLEVYDISGKRLGAVPAGEAVGVDVRYGALGEAPLIVAAEAKAGGLRFYRPAGSGLREVSARVVPLGTAVEGVCLYRSTQDGSLYAFALGDGGEIDQYLLFAPEADRVDAKLVRRLHTASTVEHCVADDDTGDLYVSEQAVGIWRFNAEPETEVTPALIDAVRLGRIKEEAGGLALFDGGGNARWLLASDASTGRIYVYDRSKDDRYVGAVAVSGRDGPVSNPGGLYAISAPAVSSNTGVLLVADEDASAGSNYKIVPFDRIATALRIPAGSPQPLTAAVTPKFPTVQPVIETQPVAHAGDAADDPAIWANSLNPAASLIVGTDKKGGLHVYDMQGRSRDFVPDGKMNNVDLRGGFRLGGEEKVLVTASDRTNKAIAIYTLDTEAAKLVNVADGIQATGLSDPYGLCMYRSKRTGRTYVYISDPDGLVRQWELTAVKGDKVRAKKVRDIRFGSQTEGCVADDQRGLLYVAEEDVALWRIDAEPKPGASPSIVDKVASNPKLKADLEGIGLYDLGGGRGYLVLSSQGNNSYAIYRREGDNAYVGSFAVNADASRGIDGISETDGLDVSSANLGPGLEQGAMVAQDGRNLLPAENQNFKVVPWSSIERALNLESGK